jgi:hypothetical protein
MRWIHLGAAAVLLLLGGCGDFYGDNAGEALRSNAGFTRENPPPVGPPVAAPAMALRHPSDAGANPSQAAPVAVP